MKITGIEIDWMEQWGGNDARIIVLVDKRPDYSKLRYKTVKKTGNKESIWACHDNIVNFYYLDGSDKEGYGGRTFTLTMEDGTKRNIVGPWSSRCGIFNKCSELEPCTEVLIRVPDSGNGNYAHMTVKSVNEALAKFIHPDIQLTKVVKWEHEIYYRLKKDLKDKVFEALVLEDNDEQN